LITQEELIEQYRILHETTDYGNTGDALKDTIVKYVDMNKIDRVLDYGCGRSNLSQSIGCKESVKYDPAIKEYSEKPTGKFDLVICTDVLEHIPEEHLSSMITDIQSFTDLAFYTICTRTAHTILPNGMNAHCTVKDMPWWIKLLEKHYGVIFTAEVNPGEGFSVICNDNISR
jgi:hypothetical protein